MSRSLSVFAAASFALFVAGCGSSTPPPAPPAEHAAPSAIELPASVSFPEGIAYDAAAGALYTASAADGAVVRVNAATGEAETVTPAGTLLPAGDTTFPGPLGMTVDDAKRLWVAGGFTGKVWVIDTANGTVVKTATVPTAPRSLINDVRVVGNAAYLTDTFVPTLWRVAIDGTTIGDPEPWLDLQGTAIDYTVEGPKLNGIAATPDGQSLIVVHMDQGRLFKIDIASKAISPIDTAGADLRNADGLVLDGHTLYVVRQADSEVAAVTLNHDLSAGTVASRFTNDGLAFPATAVKVGDDLVVVNTQFNTRADQTQKTPFTLLRVPVARLAGQ